MESKSDAVALAPAPAGDGGTSSPSSTSKTVTKCYSNQCSRACTRSHWSEHPNRHDELEAILARAANVPIIHRFNKDDDGEWVTHSFIIQDASMKEILQQALTGYQDLDLSLENYTFTPPFMPLCHRWEALQALRLKQKEPAMAVAALKLIGFLIPILAPKVDSVIYTRETGKIAFADIWQVFAPGTLVLTKFFGVETICRVTRYQKRKIDSGPYWEIRMEFVDWNGETSGFSTTDMSIQPYEGYRHVTLLPAFPISYLKDEESYRASMIQRGMIFERLREFHLMEANGTRITIEEEEPVRRPISGRVCVDACAYYTSCDITKPALRAFPRVRDEPGNKVSGDPAAHTGSSSGNTEDHMDIDTVNRTKDPKFAHIRVEENVATKVPVKRVEDLEPLDDEQRLLTTPWVRAFDLKSKQWCQVRVDQLQPVAWNDEAFNKLVLPGDGKQLAWEFVEARSLAHSEQFDDFIPDKGRGLIVLMYGPPGVGKTFTAEAIADKARVPLYSLSAAELGISPHAVEKALEHALGLCRMWNAMLLLDEADVFLGVRTSDSLVRNELVAIFLRKVKYYQGVMFLTTNRVASIDTAFQSRVDLFLPYYDLTSEARREVWLNFIEHAGGPDRFDVKQETLEQLSQLPLNGREIKNLIKSAQLLSLRGGAKVSLERVHMLAMRRVHALAQAGADQVNSQAPTTGSKRQLVNMS
ncbi:P-loop containing nucleoside triphosphate hydrolase protein [Xylaria bambusicola]|uniref:P-loop containing nucleoside triphosphate hydrolase protein n=1 Tax=Xylaria bambusicola TaxID=326684 RepID=UPI0020079DF4|nr:P-loop containing nucleoside triphosphate hydrolase protein [Xylaria bambusicola]KAI0502743.1 P-loop containing nucleoside triphosphate hydrolase protein [Xylaria bambusicola]